MDTPNVVVFAQGFIYLLLFILAFFTCVPAGVNVNDFNGHCLLYAKGVWMKEENTSHLTNIDWGPDSACNFTIFIGVISLLIALFYVVWILVILIRGLERSWLEEFISLVVNFVMCICFFSTAMTVSVGFSEWCKLILDPRSGIEKCRDGQHIPFDYTIHVDLKNYYAQWQIGQFGVWSSWILWLVLTIMSVIRMYNYHRQETFMISVNRERQRLLAQVGHHSEPA